MNQLFILILFIYTIILGFSLNCHQEKDVGINCGNYPITLKFYFDFRTNVCQPLFYRGCNGNENRFDSRKICTEKCVPKRFVKPAKKIDSEEGEESEEDDNEDKDMTLVVNQCKLPTDAKIFEKVKKCDNGCPIGWKCTKKNYCCPYKDHICQMPASSGSERIALKHYGRYAFQPGLKNCIRFSYFGLGGNYNNFLSYNDCKDFCMKKENN